MKDDVVEGYETIIKMQKEEIFELKKYKSEVIQLQNLVDGYKKMIENLNDKLRQKQS